MELLEISNTVVMVLGYATAAATTLDRGAKLFNAYAKTTDTEKDDRLAVKINKHVATFNRYVAVASLKLGESFKK